MEAKIPNSPRPSSSRRITAGKRSCPFDQSSNCAKKLLRREISVHGNRAFNSSIAQEKFRNFQLQVFLFSFSLSVSIFLHTNKKNWEKTCHTVVLHIHSFLGVCISSSFNEKHLNSHKVVLTINAHITTHFCKFQCSHILCKCLQNDSFKKIMVFLCKRLYHIFIFMQRRPWTGVYYLWLHHIMPGDSVFLMPMKLYLGSFIYTYI